MLALALLSAIAPAPQSPCSEVKLTASDGAANDRYGYGIEIEGDRLLVPSKHDAFPLADQGSAYVYEWNGASWVETAHFAADDAQAGDLFGWEAVLKGDRAVFGAPFHDGPVVDSGSAYIFEVSGGAWSQVVRLDASDALSGDYFGRDISMDGDRIVVGAPFGEGASNNCGAAYVFELVGGVWTEVQKLTAPDSLPQDRFGWNTTLDGDRIVLGAPFNDEAGNNAGAAYVYERIAGSFQLVAKIIPADATSEFGWQVELQGDVIAIGSPADATFGARSGAMYLFEGSGTSWTELQKIIPPETQGLDRFGTTMRLDGDRLLTSAFTSNLGGNNAGSAYLYSRSGNQWNLNARWASSDIASGDFFGRYLDLDGDRIAISSIHDGDLGFQSGSAYVYELPETVLPYCYCTQGPCGNGQNYASCTNSTGAGALLTGCGSASLSADDLVLSADNVPANQFGIMIMGTAPAGVVLGDGIRCVGGSLFRFATQNSGATGTLTEGPGMAAFAASNFSATGQITAGSTWYFAAWFRDPSGPCASGNNLTNGVQVTFTP